MKLLNIHQTNDNQTSKFMVNTNRKFYGICIHHKQYFQKTMRSVVDKYLNSVYNVF